MPRKNEYRKLTDLYHSPLVRRGSCRSCSVFKHTTAGYSIAILVFHLRISYSVPLVKALFRNIYNIIVLFCAFQSYEIGHTIRDAVLTCAQKLTRVSLIYRTEPTTKKGKTEEILKSKNGYAQKYCICVEENIHSFIQVSVNSLQNPWCQS